MCLFKIGLLYKLFDIFYSFYKSYESWLNNHYYVTVVWESHAAVFWRTKHLPRDSRHTQKTSIFVFKLFFSPYSHLSACSTVWNQWCCALLSQWTIFLWHLVYSRDLRWEPHSVFPELWSPNLASTATLFSSWISSHCILLLWLHTTTVSPPASAMWKTWGSKFFSYLQSFCYTSYFLLNLDCLWVSLCVWDYHSEQDEWAVIQLVHCL